MNSSIHVKLFAHFQSKLHLQLGSFKKQLPDYQCITCHCVCVCVCVCAQACVCRHVWVGGWVCFFLFFYLCVSLLVHCVVFSNSHNHWQGGCSNTQHVDFYKILSFSVNPLNFPGWNWKVCTHAYKPNTFQACDKSALGIVHFDADFSTSDCEHTYTRMRARAHTHTHAKSEWKKLYDFKSCILFPNVYY